MIYLAALLLLQSADEYPDAAHRADQARTVELNRRAADRAVPRVSGAASADYQAARRRYEKAMANWRRRVADCEAGDYRACQ